MWLCARPRLRILERLRRPERGGGFDELGFAPDMTDPAVAAPVSSTTALEPPRAGTVPAYRPSLLKILIEIALIATGVFLGLAADQWRDREQHRDAARASLRRFRAEIVANRQAVAAVREYHMVTRASVRAYLAKDHKTRNVADVPIRGLQWVSFEHTAWDLSLATQSLSYLDEDVAFSLSRIYSAQQSYAELTRGMTQAMYLLPRQENFDAFAEAADAFFGDLVVMEPKLITMYDAVLPRIDRALGATGATPSGSAR